jgi:hypothetical protein
LSGINLKEQEYSSSQNELTVEDKDKILRIDNKLPQIILPQSKIGMFIDWYNNDLRLLGTLPEAYNEGYLIIENDIIQIDISKQSEYIKSLAKQLNGTYRQVENRLKYFIEGLEKVTMYFKYADNNIQIWLYGKDNTIVSKISFQVQEGENSLVADRYIDEFTNWDDLLNEFNFYCVILLTSSLWYIATTTKTTKYYYEENRPRYTYSANEKSIKSISKHKTINTPIYDFNKIKKVKVESLIKKRKGWTYSHSFQVHGHYRHYSNGKTVFINSYIKGKNKELQSQIITLNPKE